MVETTENDFCPIALPCDSVLPVSPTNQNHLVLVSFLATSSSHYPADGAVTEVVAAVPKEVCGVSMEEVSHNAIVTMAVFLGLSGLKKHLDSSLVTELKIASSQELVFSSNATVRGCLSPGGTQNWSISPSH